MIKLLITIVIGIMAITLHAREALISVILESAPSTLSVNSSGIANYVVTLSACAKPLPYPLSVRGGIPKGGIQITDGVSPCNNGALSLCQNNFILRPGESCCLSFALDSNQMSIGGNILAPLVGTTPPAYQGKALPFVVNINRAAYVTSFASGNQDASSIYQCSFKADGSFDLCSLATNLSGSFQNIAFANVSNIQYAYVTDSTFPIGNVYQCTINPDGSFNTCNTTGPSSWLPFGIGFAAVGGTQYAYVTDSNFFSAAVFRCSLNSDGSFNICNPTPATGAPLWLPVGVAVGTVNNTQYAYVADINFLSPNMFVCTLNNDGSFNTCNITPSTGAPTWFPLGITIATVNGTPYAYVSDANVTTGNVYKCTLNNDGSFNTCTLTPSTGAPNWQPEQIAFSIINGKQYAYVANNNGDVFQCTLDSDGSFNTCNSTPAAGAPSWSPAGIAITSY